MQSNIRKRAIFKFASETTTDNEDDGYVLDEQGRVQVHIYDNHFHRISQSRRNSSKDLERRISLQIDGTFEVSKLS